jgi:hypothetical protein
MNGVRLQEQIYAGFMRAAKHVGRAYEVFRADTALEPTDSAYSIGSQFCLFAAEKKFEVPQKFKIPARYLYADGRELAPRDILIGPYGTFYVGDMQPNLPMQAVWCNETVSIDRPGYIGAEQTTSPIASGLPCFRQLKKVDQKPTSAIGGSSTAAVAFGEFYLFTPLPLGLVIQGDVITCASDNRRFSLDTIDNTEIGVVLTMRQADAI